MNATLRTLGLRILSWCIDGLLLAFIELPFLVYCYLSAWAGNDGTRRNVIEILAVAVLWAYSSADLIGATPGKLLTELSITRTDGRRANFFARLVRWWLKWWWILLSPVLLHEYRLSGSIFWSVGVPPPQWPADYADSFLWLYAGWLALDLIFLLSGRGRTLHDLITITTVAGRAPSAL